MQKRKSKKSNKCINHSKLSSLSVMVGPQSGRDEGGRRDCCDMQNAASLQNFCFVLAPGKFPVPWLTQKVKIFKAFQSYVSPFQGVSALTSTEFRNRGITGIFWVTCLQQTSSPHGANCTSRAGSDCLVAKARSKSNVFTIAVERWPPNQPKKRLSVRLICIKGPRFLLFLCNIKATMKLKLTSNKTSGFHLCTWANAIHLGCMTATQAASFSEQVPGCREDSLTSQCIAQNSGQAGELTS